MKAHQVIILITAGIAFLAVSLWAFLSNGKSARALRYKYKLGGILLTAWATLSTASCAGTGPFVTCYEPEVQCYDVAVMADEISVSVKDQEGNQIKSGNVLVVNIEYPNYTRYRVRISYQPENGDPVDIQVAEFEVVDGKAGTEITLAATKYKGVAQVTCFGLLPQEDGTLTETNLGKRDIEII